MDRISKTRMLRILKSAIFLGAFLACTPAGAETTLDDIKRIESDAQKMKDRITLPANKNSEGKQTAENLFNLFHSDDYRNRIEQEKERILETHFEPFIPVEPDENKVERAYLDPSERIFVLVTSAMPESVLKNYIRDLSKINDPNTAIVFRGFIDGIVNPNTTMSFIQKLVQDETGKHPKVKIQIDPHVFSKFSVTKAPAVVYAWNIDMADLTNSVGMPGNLEKDLDAAMVCGDASLDYALDQIYEETGRDVIKTAVKKIRGNFYDE